MNRGRLGDLFYCASHAHIEESLSVVSLGNAVRLRLPLGRRCRATGSRLKGNAHAGHNRWCPVCTCQ